MHLICFVIRGREYETFWWRWNKDHDDKDKACLLCRVRYSRWGNDCVILVGIESQHFAHKITIRMSRNEDIALEESRSFFVLNFQKWEEECIDILSAQKGNHSRHSNVEDNRGIDSFLWMIEEDFLRVLSCIADILWMILFLIDKVNLPWLHPSLIAQIRHNVQALKFVHLIEYLHCLFSSLSAWFSCHQLQYDTHCQLLDAQDHFRRSSEWSDQFLICIRIIVSLCCQRVLQTGHVVGFIFPLLFWYILTQAQTCLTSSEAM